MSGFVPHVRRLSSTVRHVVPARQYSERTGLPVDLDFIRRCPKVELHAHINGCIRDETILELLKKKGASAEEISKLRVQLGDERTLSQCFDLFSRIHTLVTSVEVVERVTREAIEDFAADNVRYLELRS